MSFLGSIWLYYLVIEGNYFHFNGHKVLYYSRDFFLDPITTLCAMKLHTCVGFGYLIVGYVLHHAFLDGSRMATVT